MLNQSQYNVLKNNNAIDFFKFIFSYFVMIIHCTPFIVFGEGVNLFIESTLPRLAVPYFFACSGFFFFKNLDYNNGKIINSKENRQKLHKYIIRLSILYVIWSVIYLSVQIYEWYHTNWLSLGAFKDYFISFFTRGSYYHMWYVLYLIFATIALYFIMSISKRFIVYGLAVVFYIISMFAYAYDLFLPPVNITRAIINYFPSLFYSITRALPLICIGIICIKHSSKRVKYNLIGFIISFLGLIAEFCLINNFTDNHSSFSYIVFTIPCTYFLFR